MKVWTGAVVGSATVMAGILSGLLVSNFNQDKDRQVSPWPYIIGIVMVLAVAGATVVAT